MNNVSKEQPPQHSAKFLRKRKFLLVLPVLVLPFLIFLLWTVGLVGEVKAEDSVPKQTLGLNMVLPSAAPAKDSNWNKMKYYEQADKDSAHLKNLLKNDPYRKMDMPFGKQRIAADTMLAGTKPGDEFHYAYDPYPKEKLQDRNEERVYKKLAALNKELETASARDQQPVQKNQTKKEIALPNPDVERLETMMQSMQQAPDEDPELKQLNELLEKVIDVQHPQRMEDKIRQESEQNKRQLFPVQHKQEDIISIIERKREWQKMLQGELPDTTIQHVQSLFNRNRFYALEEETTEEKPTNAIAAVVHEAQTLVSGATIKLRLLEDVFIAGVNVAKDQFVYGTSSLNGERLLITITSIRNGNTILPVALSVYDGDGLPGIYIPGAITRDVAKRSATQSVQNLGAASSLDPSLGAQVAGAGIQAAQTLLAKNAKLVKVHVKGGYFVLLKDDNQKNK